MSDYEVELASSICAFRVEPCSDVYSCILCFSLCAVPSKHGNWRLSLADHICRYSYCDSSRDDSDDKRVQPVPSRGVRDSAPLVRWPEVVAVLHGNSCCHRHRHHHQHHHHHPHLHHPTTESAQDDVYQS